MILSRALTCAFAFFLVSCANTMSPAAARGPASKAMYDAGPGGSDMSKGLAFNFAPGQNEDAMPSDGAARPPALERRMTYSAQISLEVARATESLLALKAEVTDLGGYLVARAGSSAVFRVPAAEFESLLEHIRTLGRVLDESMQAEDVTKQHRDLTIRLENARKSRDRLLALLEKAEDVEDILRIEKELQRLTTEIEQATAILANLDERIAYSEVTVQLNSVRAAQTPRTRRRSQFGWINSVGVDEVIRWF